MITFIIKYAFALLFLFSAFAKLFDYSATVDFFSSLSGLETSFSKILLSGLILIELLVAYLVLMDFLKKRIVFLSIFSLLVFFISTNIFFAFMGFNNCGCFGNSIISSPLFSIVKNIALLSGLIYLRKSVLKSDNKFVVSIGNTK
jgi:hypothetical protein